MRVIQIEIPYLRSKRKNAATCVLEFIMLDATDAEIAALIADRRKMLEAEGFIPMTSSRAIVRHAGEWVRGMLVMPREVL